MECKKPILVVEDDPAVREAMALVLGMDGYQVAGAGDGAEALEYLRHNDPPCLILLDLQLPRLDGRRFHQEKSRDARLASVPVVIISAASEAQATASALGAAGFLLKPVEPETLLAVVRSFAAPCPPPDILLVESRPEVRSMVASALQQHGFGVRLAADGREAAELFRKHHPDIGLVLLDTRLGDPETLAALRDVDPQVRCCLLDRDAEAAQALRALMRPG
jgi:DNA-binding response OmpR family regulator